MLSNHIILCHPLLLLPLVFPSIRVFPMSQLFASGSRIFSFIIRLSNEYSELISFRTDWFDLLAIQGTLKSLIHHNLKASVLQHSTFFMVQHSPFFMVQHSHPYMTIGKNIALTIWTFVGKVMSLLLNTLSRFVIPFLPRNKHLLISWLQSLSKVSLEPTEIKAVTRRQEYTMGQRQPLQ